MRHRFRLRAVAATVLAGCLAWATSARAAVEDLPKGQRLLIERGLEIHGVSAPYDPFNLNTYQAANYTAVNWLWDSAVQNHGAAPGVPWARWVRSREEMAPRAATQYGPAEGPYMDKLVALQLGDETNLNDTNVRNDYVNWYNEIRAANPAWLSHTILYNNSAGGAVGDAALDDFIRRARPDMIVFDSYRHFQPTSGAGPAAWPGGSPTPYYSDMRRYRQHAVMGHGIPLGVYRQTFHDDVFRDLSRSEFRLESFGPLAFGAKFLTDFTYNTGASSYFNGPGDTNPTPLYAELAEVNRQVRNLGPALVRLQPKADASFPDQRTTNIQFIRGSHRTSPTTTAFNDLPIGFAQDPQSAAYSEWEFARNDPYLSGWNVVNLGTTNDGLDGDVLISWFKPLDESFDGPNFNDETYFMVTNGLTDPTGTPADTRQQITLTFGNTTNVVFPYNTLERLNRDTGQVEIVQLNRLGTNRAQLVLTLDGGTSDLFKFPTGAPFVGVPEPGSLGLAALGTLALRRRRARTPHP